MYTLEERVNRLEHQMREIKKPVKDANDLAEAFEAGCKMGRGESTIGFTSWLQNKLRRG